MNRMQETAEKLKRVRKLMENEKLSAILLKKQANFSWITAGGLNMVGIATEIGVSSVLVTPDECYVIANRIESPRMLDEEVSELGFKVIEFEWYENKELQIVRDIIKDGEVGCDVNIQGLKYIENEVNKLRYELTEPEVERYMYLGEKVSRALESVLLFTRPGDRECEIAGRISEELWKYRIDPTGFMVAADERAKLYRHPIPTTKKIERLVMVSVNARYKGLITTVTRMVHFGKPTEQLINQYKNNVEIECIMIEKTKPGRRMNEPVLAAIEEYEKRGYHNEWKLHHQGGAMGYFARDVRVTPQTEEIIRNNQAFCWNPTISGTKSEDGFIATHDGPIMITKPFVFPTIKIEMNGMEFVKPFLLVL